MTKVDNSTISIGIDLGTTNSSIAVNVNEKIEIIKKPGGVGYTPSVFGFNKAGNKIVGQKAYEYLYKYGSSEAKNFKAEIKRLMGTPETVFFERAKTEMTPEEISSEILQELKGDALKKYPDFPTTSAVITIPAAFSILQSEATKKAGNLAGFKHVVLLQEPIAAAVSYGFQNAENENWLIYDLGGGTFDVALISSKDGILSVLGHGGDNFLGGKNIDLDIVDKIITPKILEKYQLKDFTRKNEKYKNIFSHLKYSAELAKIELSQYDETTIEIEEIGKDDSGKEISLSINMSRSELEDIVKPIVDRTIELTNSTLQESGLTSESVKRLILVGGPTQMPYLKERLENELGVQVDSSVDPLTVVAHGACIFAMSKTIPKELLKNETEEVKDANKITLNYSPLTSDTEESVTGIIEGLGDSEQFYIQIQSDSGTFTGAKTKINKGKFYYPVNIEPNRQNLFWIYVFDQKGSPIKIYPDSFSITHGLSVSAAPIPHSIGVVISKKDVSSNAATDVCEKILEKGSILPLKKTLDVYKTSRILKKDEDSSLDIDIVEGESEIPDRNTFVCKLGIKGKELPHDLPEGTPVELTVEYTESREIFVTAYVPLIDMTLNARRTQKDEQIDPETISSELEAQRHRAKEIIQDSTVEQSKKIDDIIDSVEKDSASTDEDDIRKANKQLKDLKILLDKSDQEKTTSNLIKEFNSRVEETQKVIQEYANPDELDNITKQFERIKSDGEQAVKSENKVMLIQINEQLDVLESHILFSNFGYCTEYFKYVVSLGKDGRFTNEQQAQYCIQKGAAAIESEDIGELKRWTAELNNLLPSKEHADSRAGLTK